MIKTFRAGGKLLLTGEYLVLQGARALVLPMKHGQTMQVSPAASAGVLEWIALEKDQIWFSARLDKNTLRAIQASDTGVAESLSLIFQKIRALNPDVLSGEEGWKFETRLEFRREFGWGSSSSLLVLLAQWAEIDPFRLHFSLSNGSGYDIAAAMQENPFIYTLQGGKPVIEISRYAHAFPEQVFYAFLGAKQHSGYEVAAYRGRDHGVLPLEEISRITDAVDACNDLNTFGELLREHEAILSQHLGRKSLKEVRFPDFPGVVKSLGAWGGDFALFIAREGRAYLNNYLAEKGITDIFSCDELFSSNTI